MGTTEIDDRFRFHPALTDDRKAEHEYVREACRVMAHHLDEELPDGREKSLAITKLEEVMFWANAAIARQV